MGVERNPRWAYEERLALRRTALANWEFRDRALSWARLALFVLMLVLGGWILFGETVGNGWFLFPPSALFVVLIIVHDRVDRRRREAARSVAYYEWGLARIDERWQGMGSHGEEFLDAAHPYAVDLDLFGEGSLYQLLCTARTRAGEETLARWLSDFASCEEAMRRQEAVRELEGRVDFREELFQLADEVRSEIEPGRLAQWGEGEAIKHLSVLRLVALVLAILVPLTAAGWWLFGLTIFPLLVALVVEVAFALALRSRLVRAQRACDAPCRDLPVLSGMLSRIEREEFQSVRLRELARLLRQGPLLPSRAVARLLRLVEMLEAQRNQLFAVISPFLLWGTQWTLAIEAWRARYGPHLREWLSGAGELEVLLALAGYAFEHRSQNFPELVAEGPRFEAEELGHPLLSGKVRVCNEVRLGSVLRLLIVSGSNMSGKSTFLRTVGCNLVLARAGSVVCASRLVVSDLTLGASIRIVDSLREGTSRFYAEISRIKQLVDLAGQGPPLLFLLDEVLHGTNSHDRKAGTEAIVRTLLQRRALGLVTTHDLALAAITKEYGESAANVHFSDFVEDGKMRFDYRMRPGIVQKTNALELMRSIGLDVDGESTSS